MRELDDGFRDWGLLEPLGGPDAVVGDDALLQALIDVERALLVAWSSEPGAPDGLGEVAAALSVDGIDRDALLHETRRSGVAAISLVDQLRERAEIVQPYSGRWLHRGATSQDIMDTALVLVSARALGQARHDLVTAGGHLAALADAERGTVAMARTLTQHATPLTFGARAAGWLDGVSSVIGQIDGLELPVQLGGPVGIGDTFDRGATEPGAAARLRALAASELGLDDPGRSWQVERTPLLRIAGAAADVSIVLGRVGRDLALLASTEVGELLPGSGGGSSSMPHKHNPVGAVLLSAGGLRAPGLLSTVQICALGAGERPAGEWHASWQAVRALLRLAVDGAAAASVAFADLSVEHEAIADNLGTAHGDEATMLAGSAVVDEALRRFDRVTKGPTR
jgi:3-carboxy-cis,cis-muconate cycloisomerase